MSLTKSTVNRGKQSPHKIKLPTSLNLVSKLAIIYLSKSLRIEKVYTLLFNSFAIFDASDPQRAMQHVQSDSVPALNVRMSEILEVVNHATAKLESINCSTDTAEDLDQSLMVRVFSDGLRDERDWTWHRIEYMHSNVPHILLSYLTRIKSGHKHSLVKSAQRMLNAS